MNTYVTKTYLFVAGLTMLVVGSYIALTPQAYLLSLGVLAEAGSGLGLAHNPGVSINMLNDLRGMGGMLLFLGGYILTSTFRKSWQQPALMMSVLVYTAFVVFRSMGFVEEGLPDTGLITAFVIELILALIGIGQLKVRRLEPACAK